MTIIEAGEDEVIQIMQAVSTIKSNLFVFAKTRVAYELAFNRHFSVFKPARDRTEIDAELKGVSDRILARIGGLSN